MRVVTQWIASFLAFSMLIGGTPTVAQAQPDSFGDNQTYWNPADRKAPHGLHLRDQCTPEMKAALASEYGRPPMMALGDSLYNGVQALRINWWLSEWSPPALLAIRLGAIEEYRQDRNGVRTFYGPQYEGYDSAPADVIDYGMSVERLDGNSRLGHAMNLARLPRTQGARLRSLMNTYTPPNGRVLVDNLAFSGANSLDLLNWTAGDHRQYAGRLMRNDWLPGRNFIRFGDAFTAANAAFVMNPTRHPCVEGMTPLDQVDLRQPERLFINVGANNGIFRAAFGGTPISAASCPFGRLAPPAPHKPRCLAGRPIKDFLEVQLVQDIETMMERLRESHIKYVYINGIVEPSGTANVGMVRGENGEMRYSRAFTATPIAGRVIEDADASAQATNMALRSAIAATNARRSRSGTRFVFVDTNAVLRRYDYKRCTAEGRTAPNCERVRAVLGDSVPALFLDNRPMTVRGETGVQVEGGHVTKLEQGGVFSFDNMHLSITGYELMARSVAQAMADVGDPALVTPAGCARPGDARYRSLQIGDCRRVMVEPGTGYGDATRRQYTFERVAGDEAQRDSRFIGAAMAMLR